MAEKQPERKDKNQENNKILYNNGANHIQITQVGSGQTRYFLINFYGMIIHLSPPQREDDSPKLFINSNTDTLMEPHR